MIFDPPAAVFQTAFASRRFTARPEKRGMSSVYAGFRIGPKSERTGITLSYDKNACIALLREKQQSLAAQGLGRYARRGDFTEEEVVAIKAYLGPWPRALEAVGIKPPRLRAPESVSAATAANLKRIKRR